MHPARTAADRSAGRWRCARRASPPWRVSAIRCLRRPRPGRSRRRPRVRRTRRHGSSPSPAAAVTAMSPSSKMRAVECERERSVGVDVRTHQRVRDDGDESGAAASTQTRRRRRSDAQAAQCDRHRSARVLGHSWPVAQDARHRGEGEPGGLRDAGERGAAHRSTAVVERRATSIGRKVGGIRGEPVARHPQHGACAGDQRLGHGLGVEAQHRGGRTGVADGERVAQTHRGQVAGNREAALPDALEHPVELQPGLHDDSRAREVLEAQRGVGTAGDRFGDRCDPVLERVVEPRHRMLREEPGAQLIGEHSGIVADEADPPVSDRGQVVERERQRTGEIDAGCDELVGVGPAVVGVAGTGEAHHGDVHLQRREHGGDDERRTRVDDRQDLRQVRTDRRGRGEDSALLQSGVHAAEHVELPVLGACGDAHRCQRVLRAAQQGRARIPQVGHRGPDALRRGVRDRAAVIEDARHGRQGDPRPLCDVLDRDAHTVILGRGALYRHADRVARRKPDGG